MLVRSPKWLRVRGLGGRLFSRVFARSDQFRGVWGPSWGPKTASSDQRRPTRQHEACRAMFPPPDSTDRPGCTSRRGVHGQALDQGRPFGPQHQAVGPSTGAAALLRRYSTRWSNITSRPSSHRPPRWIPWKSASPHGLSATSGTTLRAVPPALWHSRSWICTSPVCRLWLRLSGGVLLPEPGSMSVV